MRTGGTECPTTLSSAVCVGNGKIPNAQIPTQINNTAWTLNYSVTRSFLHIYIIIINFIIIYKYYIHNITRMNYIGYTPDMVEC